MRIDWVHKPSIGRVFNYGYATFNRQIFRWAQHHGLTDDRDAAVAFHCCSPRMFRPIRNKCNVVFTMWESYDFPEVQRPYLEAADILIVPSQFVWDIFRPVVPTQIPIHVVPLGYDHEVFRSHRRVWQPGDSFQWLNVGAPNARKGWDVIEEVWNRHFIGRDDCHLYCKTTSVNRLVEHELMQQGFCRHAEGVYYRSNIIMDFRHLPPHTLAQTYHNSHGFIFPTAGEGYGLTLLESLATSLPSITTRYSGVLDFTNEETVCYVDYKPVETVVKNDQEDITHVVNSAYADEGQTIAVMEAIMDHYPAALKMGRRAARSVRHLTWEACALTLLRILKTVSQPALSHPTRNSKEAS